MSPPPAAKFDPLGLLGVLQQHHVEFILIGALARVIQGTEELTRGVDITPEMKPVNLRFLTRALTDLDAQRTDGQAIELATEEPVVELATTRGPLKIVPEPLGTRGYRDLRWAATREHLGAGVRTEIASIGDLIRMAGAHPTEKSMTAVHQLQSIVEIERRRGPSLGL